MIANLAGIWCAGQVTPPGLGEAYNTAAWSAVGIKQQLDSAKNWHALVYIGKGFANKKGNETPSFKNINTVYTSEIKYKKWAMGVSYRDKHLNSKYAQRHEFRLYGKLKIAKEWKSCQAALTVRPELRFFNYAHYESAGATNEAFRTRIKASVEKALTKKNAIKIAVEVLASAKHKNTKTEQWGHYAYADSRLSLFYTIKPKHQYQIDLGYMADISAYNTTHYLAFDVIFINIFSS